MATWPATLPQAVIGRGFSETLPDLVLRTPVESGPAKSRRRLSYNVRPTTATIIVTQAQAAIFDTFYNTDLEGGALSFDWISQRTGAAVSLRFTGVPKITNLSKRAYWEIAMQLEILP
jgi:hypothetical protein